MKSVRIRSISDPYSVRMWENMDQENSEYGHFSHSASIFKKYYTYSAPELNFPYVSDKIQTNKQTSISRIKK